MSLNILKWIDILIRRNSTAWGPPDWMHTFSMIFFDHPQVSQAYMRDDVALSVANYVKLVPWH